MDNEKKHKPLEGDSQTQTESTSANDGDKTTSNVPAEIGGRTSGLEPTRYGDWEFKGRCIDF
jgi:hypothetical protein